MLYTEIRLTYTSNYKFTAYLNVLKGLEIIIQRQRISGDFPVSKTIITEAPNTAISLLATWIYRETNKLGDTVKQLVILCC